MTAGQKIGGPIATPIRDMLESKDVDAVVFNCEDISVAANTQAAAGMLRFRYGYKYKTQRRGEKVVVYKGDDPYECRTTQVNVYRD